MSAGARLIGVGVGPGDPELMTLKACRALRQADVVAHFAKAGRRGRARDIAACHLREGVAELPLWFPVTTEIPKDSAAYRSAISLFYDECASLVGAHLEAERAVAVICEGDPLFYGSYMHLHVRLAARYRTEVIAGVTGMSGCWSAAGTPIAQGDDVFTVLPGTLPESELGRRLAGTDAAVVMKLGRNLPKVRRALVKAGRLGDALYVERGTMADALLMRLADKDDDCAPYFAVVLVPGWNNGEPVARGLGNGQAWNAEKDDPSGRDLSSPRSGARLQGGKESEAAAIWSNANPERGP
jgi:precorrin-2/cobalt-factor-2 C20-methyltransferase